MIDYLVIKDHSSFTIQFDTWLLVGSTFRTNTGLSDSYQVKISDKKYRVKLITSSSEIALHSQCMVTNWNMSRRNIDLPDC